MPDSRTYPGAYVEELDPTAHTITGVGTATTAFVGYTKRGPVNRPVQLASFAGFEASFGDLDPDSDVSYAVRHFFLNGGTDAYVVRVARGPGDDGFLPGDAEIEGREGDKSGFHALLDVDQFNILCLPSVTTPAVYASAIAFCERQRAFCIVDTPGSVDDFEEAVAWIEGAGALKHSNAAAYWPRVRAGDPLATHGVREFPPSGAVTGVYARTDAARGVWKAPAGAEATVRGIEGLAHVLTDSQCAFINSKGLNGLRILPSCGPVVSGARTLNGDDQRASPWKYVPVRRLALHIEESLYQGTQWVVFEPNDEPLWAQIRLNVGAFMHDLFRQGAFQGASAREAYLVKCDAETTTRNDIDRGVVNIVVGFAPLTPAEFVVLTITQLAGQVGPERSS